MTIRYRCTACGNLTRFDVVATSRTRSYYHYTVGGRLHIEDTEVLEEHIDEVTCRWCGTGAHVVEAGAESGRGTHTEGPPPDG